ncbi:GNAT family N-acetyltransferase [Nocardioides sp. WG-D5]
MTVADGEGLRVVDNRDMNRFEIQVAGEAVGFAEYQRTSELVVFTHTEVAHGLEGNGLATQLIRSSLDSVRAEGLRVMPLCPFVIALMASEREYADLDFRHARP